MGLGKGTLTAFGTFHRGFRRSNKTCFTLLARLSCRRSNSTKKISFRTGIPTTAVRKGGALLRVAFLRPTARVARFAGRAMGLVSGCGVGACGTWLPKSASWTGKSGRAHFATAVAPLRFFGVVATRWARCATADGHFAVHVSLSHSGDMTCFCGAYRTFVGVNVGVDAAGAFVARWATDTPCAAFSRLGGDQGDTFHQLGVHAAHAIVGIREFEDGVGWACAGRQFSLGEQRPGRT